MADIPAVQAAYDLRELILQFGPLRGARVIMKNTGVVEDGVTAYYYVETFSVYIGKGREFVIGIPTATRPFYSMLMASTALRRMCEQEARVHIKGPASRWMDELQNHILHDRWPFDLPPPDKEAP